MASLFGTKLLVSLANDPRDLPAVHTALVVQATSAATNAALNVVAVAPWMAAAAGLEVNFFSA